MAGHGRQVYSSGGAYIGAFVAGKYEGEGRKEYAPILLPSHLPSRHTVLPVTPSFRSHLPSTVLPATPSFRSHLLSTVLPVTPSFPSHFPSLHTFLPFHAVAYHSHLPPQVRQRPRVRRAVEGRRAPRPRALLVRRRLGVRGRVRGRAAADHPTTSRRRRQAGPWHLLLCERRARGPSSAHRPRTSTAHALPSQVKTSQVRPHISTAHALPSAHSTR
jgi:hypothetical protein